MIIGSPKHYIGGRGVISNLGEKGTSSCNHTLKHQQRLNNITRKSKKQISQQSRPHGIKYREDDRTNWTVHRGTTLNREPGSAGRAFRHMGQGQCECWVRSEDLKRNNAKRSQGHRFSSCLSIFLHIACFYLFIDVFTELVTFFNKFASTQYLSYLTP